MNMFIHNIKVACRNLMKYKLQTLISVLSIAIGIVTLAFTHSMLLLCEWPEIINRMVFNYRDVNFAAGYDETLIAGCWILGIVSIIICIMGVFSTITLDTRTRRKEVAIRKVNGAKSKDIYLIIAVR